MEKRISQIFHFPNKMMAVFDWNQEQVAELQGRFENVKEWEALATRKGYDVTQARYVL